MPRNPENQNFPHTVALRLSRKQRAHLESVRGVLSPSAYLRLLVVKDMRESKRAVGPHEVPQVGNEVDVPIVP